MKIVALEDNKLTFDNGTMIICSHRRDCCEYNYADFEQLDDLARDYDFQTPLFFDPVDGAGFHFGDLRRMFFVPCYSYQNGYYTKELDVYVYTPTDDVQNYMVSTSCKFIDI